MTGSFTSNLLQHRGTQKNLGKAKRCRERVIRTAEPTLKTATRTESTVDVSGGDDKGSKESTSLHLISIQSLVISGDNCNARRMSPQTVRVPGSLGKDRGEAFGPFHIIRSDQGPVHSVSALILLHILRCSV